MRVFRFATLHKTAVYLLACAGLGTLAASGEMHPVATTLVIVGFAVSWFLEGRALRTPKATRLWNVATLGVLAVQLARAALGASPVELGVEFAAFLQINRLCNRRTARDYQQVVVLAFLHIVAATVLVSDLWYGLCFAGFVLVVPWALSLGHLRREIEGNYLVDHRSSLGGQVEVSRILNSRRIIGPGFLFGTAALSIPLFVITASFFLVFPRIGLGLFSTSGRSSTRLTGFSDRVALGGFGTIRTDPTVVMRIELPGSMERPSRLGLYWRGTSYDRYNGRSWTHSARTSRILTSDGRRQHMITRFGTRDDTRISVLLEPVDPPVLFIPEGTVAIGLEPPGSSAALGIRAVDQLDGDELRYRESNLGLQYEAYVASKNGSSRPRPLSAADRRRYLQLPRLDERVPALAESLTFGAPGDAAKASRIARYLRDTFGYTLELPGRGAKASIEEFLFRRKRGHCEYFSTAMVVLARSVGLPARNVTGFVGGRLNTYGNFYAVRQSDAHSWVEVYVEGSGWRTFDPTPAASMRLGDSLADSLSELVDALRLKWLQYVLSYSMDEQIAISRSLFERADRVRSRLIGVGGFTPGHLWELGAAALVVLITAVFWRRRRRTIGPRQSTVRDGRPEPRAVALYRRLEGALTKRGHSRPAARTPLEHARALREQGIAGWQFVELVTDRYVQARWGELPLEPAEVRTFERQIRHWENGPS